MDQLRGVKVSWKEDHKIIDEMNKASSGELWGHRLEGSSHFPLLQFLLNHVKHRGLLIDVGCGAGDLSRVWGGQYLGVDLDWVIENVSEVRNPSSSFVKVNVQLDDLKNLPECRVIFANALLDVVHNPYEILRKLCNLKAEFVIIHRQRLREEKPDSIELRESYGDSQVPSSILTFQELREIANDFAVDKGVLIAPWDSDSYSFIVRTR